MSEKRRKTNKVQDRRTVLKGLLTACVSTALPLGSILKATNAHAAAYEAYNEANFQTFRNACPRNCYDTCSIKTFVKDGVIHHVEGAKESSFTSGALCVKGYAYPRRVYSPDRIKYPMIQDVRGSGNWRRASWEEAMEKIATKILDIKKRDNNSLLGFGMTKYSGNFGITNYSVEGMMSSLGYTSRFVGTPCWPAGIDAQNYDLGEMWCNDPEDMVKSKYIIIWGGNPAWCSMHTMKYIYKAQENGAKVVVIDPIFTQTAAKADTYIRIKTGTDGALALGMCRYMLDQGYVNARFVENYSTGYDDFARYLRSEITLDWAAQETGIPAQVIRDLTNEFCRARPATIWIGFGMQRHTNGGAMVRSIDALVAMSGNVGIEGGGARYGHMRSWGFNYACMGHAKPEGSIGYTGAVGPMGDFDFSDGTQVAEYSDRPLNINKTAQEILDAASPELKMLWISCKNPFAQDFDRNKLQRAFEKLELVVSVEQFFTETVKYSDIVLPATTLFEEWSVNASYWHYWLSINEQAIAPMHEAKSNIAIGAELSKAMNKLSPGSCTYPQQIDERQCLIDEFNQGIYDYFGIRSWEDLKNGPVKAKVRSSASWNDMQFGTPSGKYEFYSELCEEDGFNALPKYVEVRKPYAPYRVLTPHVQYGLHSQFVNLDWMETLYPEPFAYINPELAKNKGISQLDTVKIYNTFGELSIRAKITNNVPKDAIVLYEAWFRKLNYNVQNLVDDEPADMGKRNTGAPGVAIHDQFADIIKI